MMKKMMKNKKFKYSALVLLALLVATVGITIAYMTSKTEAVTNTFKVGEVTTKIEEPKPIVTETTIQKTPMVTNLGPDDCIIRVRINVSPLEIANYLEDGGQIKYDDTNWYQIGDYWYYNKVLGTTEGTNTSTPVFTEVNGLIRDGKIIEGLRDLTGFDISIYQEAVQAVIADANGNLIKAYVENGDYDPDGAALIWKHYENETKKTD